LYAEHFKDEASKSTTWSLKVFNKNSGFMQQISKKCNKDLDGRWPLEDSRTLSMVPQSTCPSSVSEERNLSSSPGPHIDKFCGTKPVQ